MMTTQSAHQDALTSLVIAVAFGALLIYRYTRPMRITISRMWLGPVIFLLITAFAVWGEEQSPLMASPPAAIAAALVLGFLAGIPFGVLRGMHTTVKATDRPGVMYLGPSWVVAAIWLGAYLIRVVLRVVFFGSGFAVPLGDGLLMLAIGMLVTSYYVIYQKYRALEHEAGQA